MKKSLLIPVVLFAVLAAAESRGEVVDKIAIAVNDEVVTEGEIDRLLVPAYQKYSSMYRGAVLLKKLEEERQKVIEQLIENKLMLSEAKKQSIEVSGKEVEDKISEVMTHFESKKNFEEALAAQHVAFRDLRQRYTDQLMVKKLVDKKIGSKITLTPLDASNYYNSHTSEFAMPEEIKLWNILVKPDPVNPQKSYELAREIMRRLREGGDFAGLAKIYSEGPNASEGGGMGYVRKGDLMPEIENVVFKIKAGETSSIVQTSLGYHIFKVEEKRDARTMPFQEARRQAEEAAFRQKMEEKIKIWVEGLKKDAYIAFK